MRKFLIGMTILAIVTCLIVFGSGACWTRVQLAANSAWGLLVVSTGAVPAFFARFAWWEIASLFVAVISALFLAFFLFFVRVPARTGMTILGPFGSLRSVGPGYRFVFWGLEDIDKEIPLEVFSHKFQARGDAKNRDVVPTTWFLQFEPDTRYLNNWLRNGGEEKVKAAFAERVTMFFTQIAPKYSDRDEIRDNINKIDDLVKAQIEADKANGEKLLTYYGAKLPVVVASDIEPPEEIVKAEQMKEIEEEKNKAKDIQWKNVLKRADSLRRRGAKEGIPLGAKDAVKRVQIQDGIVKEEDRREEKRFDADPGLVAGVVKIVKEVFGGGKHKRQRRS